MNTTLLAQVEPGVMRRALGHFPTGVVVVTADTPEGKVGMTLQSFMSLSLEPALILLSVARTSKSWPAIREAGRFVVNILAEGQGTLARQFAASGTDKFADVAVTDTPDASGPVLDGAVAWIDCELTDEFDGGDHIIVVAQVRTLSPDEVACAAPLVFHRSKFPTLTLQG